MPLSIGIVGLPNVGKSTLFNTLTKKQIEASNYPFCTIDPNVGVVKVPDARLLQLSEISKSKKILPTIIEFTDIAGLVRGAHKGEGLGNKFLHNIRECDAICMVLRNFEDENIVHVHGKINALEDRETINTELIMADLESVEKILARVTKEAKSGDKELVKQKNLLEKIKVTLDEGLPARKLEYSDDEKIILKSLHLLSAKPIIYVENINDSTNLETSKEIQKNLNDGNVISLNVKQEVEIATLPEKDQEEFIKELGLEESGLDKLIKSSYELLGLLTFITTGVEETRAWTIKKGAKAPQAAGVIHTDFEKGFIRAEIIDWKKLIEAGGEAAAREKGFIKTEGKDYVMKDGDVCHFLFN